MSQNLAGDFPLPGEQPSVEEETDELAKERVDKAIENFVATQPAELQQKISEEIERCRAEANKTDDKVHFILNDNGKTLIAASDAIAEYYRIEKKQVLGIGVWRTLGLVARFIPDDVSKAVYFAYQQYSEKKAAAHKHVPSIRFTMQFEEGKSYSEGIAHAEHHYFEGQHIGTWVRTEDTVIDQAEFKRRKKAHELIIPLLSEEEMRESFELIKQDLIKMERAQNEKEGA